MSITGATKPSKRTTPDIHPLRLVKAYTRKKESTEDKIWYIYIFSLFLIRVGALLTRVSDKQKYRKHSDDLVVCVRTARDVLNHCAGRSVG